MVSVYSRDGFYKLFMEFVSRGTFSWNTFRVAAFPFYYSPQIP